MFCFTKLSKLRKQLRETVAFIHKRIRIDRDLMTEKEIVLLHTAADEALMGIDEKTVPQIEKQIERLNEVFQKVFPPQPDHWIRENGEVFLVAILVAMAFRAYFLQPFRIPTGSMQPTLYGITVEPSTVAPPPRQPKRFIEALFFGKKYVHVVCDEPGSIKTTYAQRGGRFGLVPEITEKRVPPLCRWWRWLFPASQFTLSGRVYTVSVPPEQLLEMFRQRMKNKGEWSDDPVFIKGEMVLNFEVITGDHLFVDRFSYNFIRPKRGDIFVFETKGIPVNASGQFYIKRCVAVPGETIQIKNDDRICIDGKPVPAEGPFKKIYSKKDGYFGHLNLTRLQQEQPEQGIDMTGHLIDQNDSFKVPPKSYWAMGDNTRSSRDSRYFGPVPDKNLVGRAFFVYWPFGGRWGKPE
jgi:signal peptidase I